MSSTINPTILKKYAHLLIHYSLYLKKGERLYISATILAAPLIEEIYLEAIKVGAIVEVRMSLPYEEEMLMEFGDDHQLNHIPHLHQYGMENYDAFLNIRAPFPERDTNNTSVSSSKKELRRTALATVQQTYFNRLGDGSLKRSLCQYPTQFNADLAEMTLDAYGEFVFNACHLYTDDPAGEWQKLSNQQQKIADFLNTKKLIRYKNNKTDISFSVDNRIWVNSDGKNNMPSGEVFSSPIEDSVNGHIHFDYTSYYNGNTLKKITLWVKEGQVYKWDAEIGKEFLDEIFEIEGTRYFGEVAIGNNYNVQKATKNILFDEKIGGTVHMAIGQSYLQCGGKNTSSVHWDMIADMKDGGEIWADGTLIYKDGKFIVAI